MSRPTTRHSNSKSNLTENEGLPDEHNDLPRTIVTVCAESVQRGDQAPECEPVDDDMSAASRYSTRTCLRKTVKYVAFAIFVFVGQIAVSVSLKHYGWIEKDFNEIVAERVVPHLQEQLMSGFKMPQFNETMYWRRINDSLATMNPMPHERLRPGYRLAKLGAKAKYPIIMVPGFVTSGLEVWQGRECAKQLFRTRMWGGVGMVQSWLMERHCVMEHMALDPWTGKDPENIRLRPAQGFEATDYFMGNYWVWSKILENLADIGYDGSMMSMESYDWRLAFANLEERDGYLTKLKYKIEAFHKTTGEKVILASHSMGATLVHYFFTWVTISETAGGGGGDKGWVNEHIHTHVSIAGAHLGLPKAAAALLSGEMSDTILLGAAGSLLEQFIGRRLRRDLWSTWGSLWSMLPKGGNAIWGVGADIPDTGDDCATGSDTTRGKVAKESFLVMAQADETKVNQDSHAPTCSKQHDDSTRVANPALRNALDDFSSRSSQTVEEAIDFLLKWGGGLGPKINSAKLHSFDPRARQSKATWHDSTRTPLPRAPDMKVYCLYGVGLDTERSYYYKPNTENPGLEDSKDSATQSVDPPFVLDTSVDDIANNVAHGVKYVNGDGTVPLLSLGYMCADAWQRDDSRLNPSRLQVITREYEHRQEFSVEDPMRSGPLSADHVDILGNYQMIEDVVKIASDFDVDTVGERIVSDIQDIADRINRHPKGGVKRRRKWRFSL